MNEIKSLAIVGGGTAGLITALILRQKLDIAISVIHSSSIGIIGVGEGSTEHFKDFMEYVGINQIDIIKKCDATYKGGIMFENWSKKTYLHNVGEPWNCRNAQYPFIYAHQIAHHNTQLTSELTWKNKINSWFLHNTDSMPFNQFHFNTHKLNDYLIDLAKSKGIKIIDDEISNVELDEQGNACRLIGQKGQYSHDFYIDATGFKRLIIGKMGAKWKSYGQYLKMKSAIVFPTEDEPNYNLWTLARAMDSGWLFRIPVWGRYGNGYIFDSDYTTADDAKKEVDLYFNRDIEIKKQFNFDPGCLDKVWIKNCVAVGLSGSFVEPLEATSIGTTIQQSFILMQKLINYNDKVIDDYNKSFNDIMENIRDFIVLHYITEKDNSLFWKNIQNLEIPDTLKDRLEVWKYKFPIDEDFNNLSDYILFKANNFALVMDGLNLFDRESIKKEFYSNNNYLTRSAKEIIEKQISYDQTLITLSHKEYLSNIRN